jgi:hypothetical protein
VVASDTSSLQTIEAQNPGFPYTHGRLGLYFHPTDGTKDNPPIKSNSEYSLSWSILQKRYNFGVGFLLTHGDDEPLELSVYLWRLGNVYFKFNNRWLRKLLTLSRDQPLWYEGRQYGLRFGWARSWLTFDWAAPTNTSGRNVPGFTWNSGVLHRKMFGYEKSEWETLFGPEEILIDMPEGIYTGTIQQRKIHKRYEKLLGRLWSKIKPLPTWESWEIDIPGGIPIEGKGENSWDCSMDGVFSCSFGNDITTALDALEALKADILKDRRRYGGPFNLPRAMSVKEASEWQMSKRSS